MRKVNINQLRRSIGQPGRWLAVLLALAGAAAAQPLAAPPDSVATAVQAAAPARPLPTARLPADRRRTLRPARLDAGRLAELRGQREFNYVEKASQLSAWDLLWMRFWEAVNRWLGERSYTHFWRWVFYGMFVVAAIFVILKLLEVDLTRMLGRSGRALPLAYDTAQENIHEVDFATRLAEAEAAGNFRLAVRLGYLALLKQLTDRGLIRWQPDKTNHAYLTELPATGPLRADFREITRQFEYVWYAELPLSAPLYEQVRARHRAFISQLSGSRTLRQTA